MSVALDGTVLVVGAPQANTARFYSWNGTAFAYAAQSGGCGEGIPQTGTSVAVRGTRALIGAQGASDGVGAACAVDVTVDQGTGAVTGVATVQTMTSGGSETGENTRFGTSAALSQDAAFVGAWGGGDRAGVWVWQAPCA